MTISIRDAATVGYDSLKRDSLKIGDLVKVGYKFAMSEHPPYVGNGTLEADQWTGTTWRVVNIRKGGTEIALADPLLEGADASDEDLEMPLRRLVAVQPGERIYRFNRIGQLEGT